MQATVSELVTQLKGTCLQDRDLRAAAFPGLPIRTHGMLLKSSDTKPLPQIDKTGIPKGRAQVKTFHESFPGDSNELPGWTTVSLREKRDRGGEGANKSAEMLMPGTGSLQPMGQGLGRPYQLAMPGIRAVQSHRWLPCHQ